LKIIGLKRLLQTKLVSESTNLRASREIGGIEHLESGGKIPLKSSIEE
jgi:hypothetical protein